MVRGEDDQGVVRRADLAEGLQQPADLRVDIARQRVAGAPHVQDVRFADRRAVAPGEKPVPPAVWVALLKRDIRNPRRVDLDAVVPLSHQRGSGR